MVGFYPRASQQAARRSAGWHMDRENRGVPEFRGVNPESGDSLAKHAFGPGRRERMAVFEGQSAFVR